MPIEIRELVIKVSVEESNAEKQKASGSKSIDREDIIADCVEQVMEILSNKSER